MFLWHYITLKASLGFSSLSAVTTVAIHIGNAAENGTCLPQSRDVCISSSEPVDATDVHTV